MMLKTVFLFNIFYLSFGTNYFNDNDWILTLNQGWPFGVCQSNSVAISISVPGLPAPTYIEYTCNDDGSVTKSEYASISDDGECMDIQNSVNYIGNFTNPGDRYAFECNSTNNYAEVNFFGHIFARPEESLQCASTATGKGTFKWSVDSCATNGETSNMLTCIPGVISVTTYGNSICDPSSIIETVTITEGECATYGDTKVPFGGTEQDLFIYATYVSCMLSEPTMAPSLAPTMEPTQITTEPTLIPLLSPTNAPSNTPSITPTDIPTDTPSNTPSNTPTDTPTDAPTEFIMNDSKGNLQIPCIFSLIFTIILSIL
mmetsp:Transcript_105159/g.128380  ORF Transcript_105159/g.128380 Transcript_105159/m.128380 type:complete len:316 (-) Transcript_105159:114-1061(-)